ncbi:GlxA family transcriptional regulator [Roseovarius sp. 2305UL8-3]|uniref:GlxA family transcriptional regulator n=1 Tax=Roseovarius conchicola TaxID=3121636 RepID=UPI003529C19F
MTSEHAQPRKQHFDIIVTDGFVLTEFAAVVDPLRTANRVTAQPLFSWTFRSAGGGTITSSSEAILPTERFAEKPDADYLFVIGNTDPDAPGLTLGNVINTYTHRGAKVFLLAEAASRYIKDKGSAAWGMSTHWENSALLRERMELLDTDNALASGDGPVVTCAGMNATMDVVLSVMGQHISSAELQTVVNIFLHEQIRDFGTRQPFGGTSAATTGDADLDRAIEIMQSRIEDPVLIGELTTSVGVSSRSLERKFRTFLGTTPNTYYRQLRLARANNLLLNTTLSVREVGLASGFAGGFSVLYKSFYGITPLEMRRRRRRQKTWKD